MDNKQGLPYPTAAALTPPSLGQAAQFVKSEVQNAAKEQQQVRFFPLLPCHLPSDCRCEFQLLVA